MNQKIIDLLNNNNKFAIVIHYDVDPDAVGGSYALKLALNKLGKEAYVFCDDEMPKCCEFLGASFEQDISKLEQADVAIAFDLNAYNRMRKYQEAFKKVKKHLLIDHHLKTNDKISTLQYVDPSRASASELVMDIIDALGVEIDRDIAMGLYTGIAGDTGCFRHTNTTASTHMAAARLFDKGVDFAQVNYHLFKEKQRGYLDLIKQASKHIKVVNDRLVYVLLDNKTYNRLGIDTNIIHEVFAGVSRDVFIKIVEKTKGSYTISFRSITTDVANICNRLGGGGHMYAAGAKMNGNKKEVLKRVLSTTLEELK